jgi:dCTP diphosphatase
MQHESALEGHLASILESVGEMKKLLHQQNTAAPSSGSSSRKRPHNDDAADASAATTDSMDGRDLVQVRDWLRKFAAERDWDQFHTPRNITLALVGEVGELSECFQWCTDETAAPGLPGWKESKREHLGEELADVLLYLVRLADKCSVDLPAAAARKIQKNAMKYPAALVKGSSKKYSDYSSEERAATLEKADD